MLGRWKLVFRQTVPFEFNPANDWDQAKSLNPLDDTQPNFSILGQLKNFRSSSDNTFKFKDAGGAQGDGDEGGDRGPGDASSSQVRVSPALVPLVLGILQETFPAVHFACT